jgi:hypothetical protein
MPDALRPAAYQRGRAGSHAGVEGEDVHGLTTLDDFRDLVE